MLQAPKRFWQPKQYFVIWFNEGHKGALEKTTQPPS